MSIVDPCSEVVVWIGLRRVQGGGVANMAGCWFDHGLPVPTYLPAVLDELTEAGQVTLAEDSPHDSLRRATLTDAGHTRYVTLQVRYAAPRRTGGEPAAPSPERWARDPDDGRLHALVPGDAHLAGSRGYAECLCRHKLPPDVIFEPGLSGALCLPCVIGAAPDLRALGLLDT